MSIIIDIVTIYILFLVTTWLCSRLCADLFVNLILLLFDCSLGLRKTITGQQVGLGIGFSRKLGWSRVTFPFTWGWVNLSIDVKISRLNLTCFFVTPLTKEIPSAHFFGEFFKLDLKEPFRGSLMIHDGGTITFL